MGILADTIQIRRCLPEDSVAIAALDRTLWGDWAYGSPLSRQFVDMGHPVFVAYASRALAGYCIGLTQADGVTGYILDLTVHPDHRKKGVGAGLAQAVIDDFRRRALRAVNAVIDDNNRSSKNLFANLGFRETKRMKDYYGPGDLQCLFSLTFL